MKNIIYFFILIFISINTVLAGTIDPNNNDQLYVQYGEKYKCIFKICGKTENGQKYCASAVVINKNWILTAAHVVQECVEVRIQDDANRQYCVNKIFIHKEFNNNQFGKNDIALGYVEEDILLDSYPELYTNNDEVGKICGISGYGLTGNFLTGCSISDSKKRAGSNYIDKIDRDLLICTASRKGSAKYTQLEFLICSGDSGGGLFIDKKLAGINSCVLAGDKKPDSTYGDEAGHTRVSLFIPWIMENMSNEKK